MIKRIAFLAAFIALTLTESIHAKTIVVSSFSMAKGETCAFEVNCNNNSTKLVSFQMDLLLPKGVSLNIEKCRLSDRFTDTTQELLIEEMYEGRYRILTTSYNLKPLQSHSGAMLYLSVTANEEFEGGEAALYDMSCATSTSVLYSLKEELFDISLSPYALGDLNRDKIVDITDVTLLVDVILGKVAKPDADCDINGDGLIDITDVLTLTDIILNL